MDPIKDNRTFLKANDWKEWQAKTMESDQQKGMPAPPVEKPYTEDAKLVDLVAPESITVGNASVREIIGKRESRRSFTDESLTLEELSFLLWATQGVTRRIETKSGLVARRTVPSGGSRHTFEGYIVINRVDGIEPGLYRYLPLEHKLLFIKTEEGLPQKVAEACCGQRFIESGAVIFIWTTVPYRMEWRYPKQAPKIIAIDSGHLCQNLYLASEAIGAGTCGIGAYYQDQIDEIIGVDGEDEFTIYIAPVGKIKEEPKE